MYFLKTKKRTKVEKADNNFPDCYNDFTISIFFSYWFRYFCGWIMLFARQITICSIALHWVHKLIHLWAAGPRMGERYCKSKEHNTVRGLKEGQGYHISLKSQIPVPVSYYFCNSTPGPSKLTPARTWTQSPTWLSIASYLPCLSVLSIGFSLWRRFTAIKRNSCTTFATKSLQKGRK